MPKLTISLFFCVALALNGCEATTARANDMDNEDKLFFQVPLNSTEPTSCSPSNPGPEWRGVIIRVPKRIPVDSKIFPLCGFYNVEMAELEDGNPIAVFAVERASRQTYSAYIADEDPSPEAPRPQLEPVDPTLLEGMAVGGYFNPNLYDYLQLPAGSATYDIFVQYGRRQSNTVTVEIVEDHRGTP